jgi:hypothetical protein
MQKIGNGQQQLLVSVLQNEYLNQAERIQIWKQLFYLVVGKQLKK